MERKSVRMNDVRYYIKIYSITYRYQWGTRLVYQHSTGTIICHFTATGCMPWNCVEDLMWFGAESVFDLLKTIIRPWLYKLRKGSQQWYNLFAIRLRGELLGKLHILGTNPSDNVFRFNCLPQKGQLNHAPISPLYQIIIAHIEYSTQVNDIVSAFMAYPTNLYWKSSAVQFWFVWLSTTQARTVLRWSISPVSTLHI